MISERGRSVIITWFDEDTGLWRCDRNRLPVDVRDYFSNSCRYVLSSLKRFQLNLAVILIFIRSNAKSYNDVSIFNIAFSIIRRFLLLFSLLYCYYFGWYWTVNIILTMFGISKWIITYAQCFIFFIPTILFVSTFIRTRFA